MKRKKRVESEKLRVFDGVSRIRLDLKTEGMARLASAAALNLPAG